MAEKVVSVKLQAKVDGFVSGMKVAKKSADDLTASSQKLSKSDAFGKLADKAAIAGLGVATAVGVAVKRFADFDQAMSAVQANTGATGASLDSLRQAAITMGADSVFSAKEAADGINELGKAGLSTADILGGGLKGSLDLAAAGQIGVAEAAETTASALSQFKLGGDQAVHVADLLTNGANKAQGGVGDLGAALNQTGLVAAQTGLSIEETTAGLASFAKAGLIGSDAGTSMKTMLMRLTPESDAAAAAMEEIGLKAYDSAGNFIGLEAVAGQLKDGLSTLSQEQQASTLKTIFGADAVRAASILYNEGSEGIAKWTSEVTEQGAAAKQAATLTDNLKGDIERLGGALDSVFIQTGSGANGGLRTLTQGITGLVDQVGKIPGPLLLAAGGLSAFALLGPKGVMAYRDYKATLDTLGISFDTIATKAPRAGKALTAAAVSAKAFGATLAAISAVDLLFFDDGGMQVDGLTKSLLDATDASDAFNDAIVELDTGSSGLGDTLKTALDPSLFDSFQNKGSQFLSVFTLGFADLDEPLGLAQDRLTELDQALSGMTTSGNGERASQVFADIARAAADQGLSVEDLKAKLPEYAAALAGASSAAAEATPRVDGLSGAQAAAADNAQEAADATKSWADALNGLNSPVLDAREAARQLEESIDGVTSSIKENGTTLDINTAKGRANQRALDGVASAAIDQIGALQANGASQKTLQGALDTSRGRLIATARQFGMTKSQAAAYADQVLAIPASRTTTATFRTRGYSELVAAGQYFKSLQDRRITLTVGTVKVGNTKVNAGQFAEGGAVYGPGTAKSDSITARLSNGEHVLTAAEVRAAGGQSAVYALRAALRQGRVPKFADGGAVMSTSRFATPSFRPVVSVTTPASDGSMVARLHPRDIRAIATAIRVGASDGLESVERGVASKLAARRKANP